MIWKGTTLGDWSGTGGPLWTFCRRTVRMGTHNSANTDPTWGKCKKNEFALASRCVLMAVAHAVCLSPLTDLPDGHANINILKLVVTCRAVKQQKNGWSRSREYVAKKVPTQSGFYNGLSQSRDGHCSLNPVSSTSCLLQNQIRQHKQFWI